LHFLSHDYLILGSKDEIVIPRPNKRRNYARNMRSPPYYSILEQDNISTMGRLVKSTMTPLGMDEQVTLGVYDLLTNIFEE
jgi:hypothetical protein